MTQISSIARYLTGFKRGQEEKHCVLSMLLFFPHVLVLLTRCHARAIPRACGMLVRCRGFVKKIKKNYMEKNCCNPQCFQGKNYKANFLTNLILKK